MERQSDIDQFYQEFQKRDKAGKIQRYRRLNRYVRKHQIVFAGSSLMEQFPVYEFLIDRQLPYAIYNRGVGGFTTPEFYDALEECVFELEPDYLFLNIGTNDMNGPEYDQEVLIRNYRKILQAIRERLPQVKLYLLAYYPVNAKVCPIPYLQGVFRYRTNERIHAANEAVHALAEEFHAEFLDCNDVLKDEQGNLKEEYTVEGMHMYADGYWPVFSRLLPVLKEISSVIPDV